jgi:hypothetical protein
VADDNVRQVSHVPLPNSLRPHPRNVDVRRRRKKKEEEDDQNTGGERLQDRVTLNAGTETAEENEEKNRREPREGGETQVTKIDIRI